MTDNEKRTVLSMVPVYLKFLDMLDFTVRGIDVDIQRMNILAVKNTINKELEESAQKLKEDLVKAQQKAKEETKP